MQNLPVREMILYKHGVAFYTREGQTDAQTVVLNFRQDEINDVLKSLAVFDRAGGQVLGIHYQTPMDIVDRLENSSITLEKVTAMIDLLTELRGRQVTATFEPTPGSIQPITGRVMGVDIHNNKTYYISVLADDDEAYIFPFEQLRWVKVTDEQSRHDLHYFLDTTMGDDARRQVNVRLTEGEHDLVVYYLAPAPTWRVSYRIVAERDDNQDEENVDATGKALLQGWGIFDNRLDEDLDDVHVTLVAGQPISFIYELYESKIPMRPTVEDQTRVAAAPVAYGSEVFDEVEEQWDGPARPSAKRSTKLRAITAAAAAPEPMGRAEMQSAVSVQTKTQDSGEFFQYNVQTPVSVKRGDSALVPILSENVDYERELLYNGAKLADHPVASLRFQNTTGLTLEHGPVTVVEDGDYKGEAIINFTKDDQQVYIPYAVELGMRVTEDHRTFTTTTGVKIDGAYAVYDEYRIQQVVYTVENRTTKAQTVTIEAPIQAYHELFDTPEPVAQTATERRWKVPIKPQGKNTFIRKERQLAHRRQQLINLDYAELQTFIDNRWLDKPTLSTLRGLLDALQLKRQSQKALQELDAEQEHILQEQEQLRQNIAALNPQGDEATFRKRIVKRLEATQDRLDAMQSERNSNKDQIKEIDKRIKSILADLGKA